MRAQLSVACAVGALMIATGFASTAGAADMVLKAPAPEAPAWWYEGYVEVGGRFFAQNPPTNELGKFYEYRDLSPGVFGNFFIGAHRTNPIDIEFWGKNVGYDDQSYGLYLAKVGSHYLTLGWDETPHVFTRNAWTTYNGIGTSVLSTPTYPFPPSAASQAFVNANSRHLDVEYRRDTASAQFRWTPNESWDFNADYSHTRREGLQPIAVVSASDPISRGAGTRVSLELPKPVDDVTQNGNVKGEYSGSTPWGTTFNLAAAYGFSLYSTDHTSLTYQNPWVAVNSVTAPMWNRYALAPDNQAQTISFSGGVGLPMNSRYMGTFQWSKMEQTEQILPSTINPLVPLATLTANNLSGDATTTLFNNVINTRWSPTVKSTVRYRYYDYHSNQDPITITGLFGNPDQNAPAEPPLTAYPRNFTKQNASADLTWRAHPWLTVGGRYGWERWEREHSDVAVTNEHLVKVFADAKWSWSSVRTELQYSERRFEGPYGPSVTANNNDAFRVKDLADRDRTQGKVSWAIEAMPVTITPLAGFRVDDYGTNPFGTPGEIGVTYVHAWNAGAEVAYNWSRRARFYFSYTFEDAYRQVYQNSATPDLNLVTNDQINTLMLGTKLTLVPDKLFLDASYTYATSTSEWGWGCGPAGCRYTPLATAPDSHISTHRLEVKAKYFLDNAIVRHAGWEGKTFVKARVLWEKYDTDAWQPIQQQLGYAIDPGNTTTARGVFFGSGNPSYNVIVAALSFGVKW